MCSPTHGLCCPHVEPAWITGSVLSLNLLTNTALNGWLGYERVLNGDEGVFGEVDWVTTQTYDNTQILKDQSNS